MAIDAKAAFAAVTAGNLLAWFDSFTVGGAVTAITAIGGASVGLAVLAIRQINGARVEAKKQWEEANRDSLSAQNERLSAQNIEMIESVKTLRKSLHDFRDETAAREQLHHEEVERLHEEIRLLHETNRQLRGEVARLTDRVRELTEVTVAREEGS